MTRRKPNVARRRAARLAAVQALYEIDIVGVPATPVLKEFLESRWSDATAQNLDDCDYVKNSHAKEILPKPENKFLKLVVHGVTDDRERLDFAISPLLNSPWGLDQLHTLVRAILRAGAFEFIKCPEVPARTIISEYVGLAHAFFSENEPAFINAILDGLAGQYRSDEFIEKKSFTS